MDTLQEVIAKIRTAAGEEIAPKIESLLKRVEAEFAAVTDDLKAANAESKERKLKIRELTSQLEETGAKATEYEARANNPEQANELAALKQFKADVLKTRRAGFAADFGAISKHANFDKAREQFKLPKPAEDGSYDFTKMADADIEHNMAKMAEYKAIGFFAEAAPTAAPPAFNLPRNAGNGQTSATPATLDGLQAHIQAAMQTYK